MSEETGGAPTEREPDDDVADTGAGGATLEPAEPSSIRANVRAVGGVAVLAIVMAMIVGAVALVWPGDGPLDVAAGPDEQSNFLLTDTSEPPKSTTTSTTSRPTVTTNAEDGLEEARARADQLVASLQPAVGLGSRLADDEIAPPFDPVLASYTAATTMETTTTLETTTSEASTTITVPETTTTTTPPETTTTVAPTTTAAAPTTTTTTTAVPIPTTTTAAAAPVTTAPPPVTTAPPVVTPPAAEPIARVAAFGAGVLITPTGVVAPILETTANGHIVRTPCSNDVEIIGGTIAPPVEVVIDPGHGGNQPGTVGPNGLVEKHVNLAVSRELHRILTGAGYSVLMTRNSDMRLNLTPRGEIAVASGARAFVSVHHNGARGQVPPGSQVFHHANSTEARRLAGLFYEESVALGASYGLTWPGNPNAGARTRWSSDGVNDYYGVLRNSVGVPGVITEFLYLTNGPESALLANPAFVTAEAQAMANGIIRFLTTTEPGSGFIGPLPWSSGSGTGQACVEPQLQ